MDQRRSSRDGPARPDDLTWEQEAPIQIRFATSRCPTSARDGLPSRTRDLDYRCSSSRASATTAPGQIKTWRTARIRDHCQHMNFQDRRGERPAGWNLRVPATPPKRRQRPVLRGVGNLRTSVSIGPAEGPLRGQHDAIPDTGSQQRRIGSGGPRLHRARQRRRILHHMSIAAADGDVCTRVDSSGTSTPDGRSPASRSVQT